MASRLLLLAFVPIVAFASAPPAEASGLLLEVVDIGGEEDSTCQDPMVFRGFSLPPIILVRSETHFVRAGESDWFVSDRNNAGQGGVRGLNGEVDLFLWDAACSQILCVGSPDLFLSKLCPYSPGQRFEVRYAHSPLDDVPNTLPVNSVDYEIGMP